MNMSSCSEHPTPQFARSQWVSLNGIWDFCFDDSNLGETEGYPMGNFSENVKIQVPFSFQTPKSGIHDLMIHETVWYKRTVTIPDSFADQRVFLHFGAVDYEAYVWWNGHYLGNHKGGYTPFTYELTYYNTLQSNTKEHCLVVKAIDRSDPAQPRGKQYWKDTPNRCWYPATTGIWQTVWLEAVPGKRIEEIRITPDIDRSMAIFDLTLEQFQPKEKPVVKIDIHCYDIPITTKVYNVDTCHPRIVVSLLEPDYIDEIHYWSPQHPHLYNVKVSLYFGGDASIVSSGNPSDVVDTYFGMRKTCIENGHILLNNNPCYLRLILAQGYWSDSGMTAPSDQAFICDISMAKQAGYNGIRMHQKIEDPRFYYWADVLGILIWGELPSAYQFHAGEINELCRDLQAFIARDYNHPSIITWVPLNESWGVRKIKTDSCQQHFGNALYYLIKAIDPTRLVSTNDGWENVCTDIISIHDYSPSGQEIHNKYKNISLIDNIYPMHRRLFALGYTYSGEPIVITEFGGIALVSQVDDVHWGYANAAKDTEELLARYADLTQSIMSIPHICGFCYTQLTDVYQEINGLLNDNHEPKLDLTRIAQIHIEGKDGGT